MDAHNGMMYTTYLIIHLPSINSNIPQLNISRLKAGRVGEIQFLLWEGCLFQILKGIGIKVEVDGVKVDEMVVDIFHLLLYLQHLAILHEMNIHPIVMVPVWME